MSTQLRAFSADDQLAFARLSGDFNPIHLDPVAARRLLFGQPVVHGMHALLRAFDAWLERGDAVVRLKRLKVRFRASIPLDAGVELITQVKSPTEVQLELLTDEAKLLTATIAFELDANRGFLIPDELPEKESCRTRGPEELASISGQVPLCLARAAARRLFPNALRRLPTVQLASLLATTRVVGMEAPGLHSILAGLDLTAEAGESPALTYRTENFDDRVSRLELRIESPCLAGVVTTFVRPEPRQQLPFTSVRSSISPDEFRGEKALVIGGSRGLGEVAVKLLAAGGADVRFTYHRGVEDAERIAAEITNAGGSAASFAYDVLRDAVKLPDLVGGWSPTLLCYFATPLIAAGLERRFDARRFEKFCSYYVTGLFEVFHAAQALGPSLKNVLCPSSVFVDELPLTMGEYAAAKSAAETLCGFLAKAYPEMRFHCPRLPRLATDQTASLIRTELPDPAPVLRAVLREMRAKASGCKSD